MNAQDFQNIARCAGERWRAEIEYFTNGCIWRKSPRFKREYQTYVSMAAQPAQRNLL